MRILVIAGRTARHPWTPGALTARICQSLAQRNHHITLAAQSIDDLLDFPNCNPILTFASFDQTATDWPHGFAAWARNKRRTISHDCCLSLSRVVAGDVWMPLEPSGASWLARARRTLSPPSLAIALARHHGALRAAASDAFFVTPQTSEDEPIRRILAIGSTAAGEASRRLHRARNLGQRVVRAEPFAPVPPTAALSSRWLRTQTRGLLNIPEDRRVILVSVPHPVGTTLDGLLLSLTDHAQRDPRHAPLLLALAKDCFALHARAVKCRATDHVRIQSLTHRMDAALAAADCVALPHRCERSAFESGAMGRLGVEALQAGRPLLALSGASGHALARLRSTAQESPGLVVDNPSRDAWTRALRQAADDAWLERAAAAAIELGAPMTFDRFADTLDRTLEQAASERQGEHTRHPS